MKDLMRLTLAIDSDLMTTVRLTTGGLCSAAGLNLDDSEDCKVCVTESLLLLSHAGYTHAALYFGAENGIFVRVTGCGKPKPVSTASEDEISVALISALAEDATMEKREEGYEVSFRFHA